MRLFPECVSEATKISLPYSALYVAPEIIAHTHRIIRRPKYVIKHIFDGLIYMEGIAIKFYHIISVLTFGSFFVDFLGKSGQLALRLYISLLKLKSLI